MPQYTKKQWAEIGRKRIDPLDAEQVGNLAALLQTNRHGPYKAIEAVGTRIGDIREFVEGRRR